MMKWSLELHWEPAQGPSCRSRERAYPACSHPAQPRSSIAHADQSSSSGQLAGAARLGQGHKMHQRECSERDLPSERVNYSFRNIMDKRVEAREVLHSNTLFLDFSSESTLGTSQVHWQTLHAHPVCTWDVWMPVKEKVWFILVMSSHLI